MFVASSFPMASSLRLLCFTSRLWSWWKTFQVKNKTNTSSFEIHSPWVKVLRKHTGKLFLLSWCHPWLATFFISSIDPCSFEEGGSRGVREVDGAICHGTAGGRWVAYENIHRNPCRWHAQHPVPCLFSYMAGKSKYRKEKILLTLDLFKKQQQKATQKSEAHERYN